MKSIGFSKAKASAKASLRVLTALFVCGGGPAGETDERDEGKVPLGHSKSLQTEAAGPAVHVEVQCSPEAHPGPVRSSFKSQAEDDAPPACPLAPPPPPPAPMLPTWPTTTFPYQEQPTFLSWREGRISFQEQAASGLTATPAAPAPADLAQSMPSPCLPSLDQTVASRMIPQQIGQGHAVSAQPATPQAPTPAPCAAPAQPVRARRMLLPAASAWAALTLLAITSGCVAGVLFLQASGAASPVPAPLPLTPLAMLTPDASNGTCAVLHPASSFSHHWPLPPLATLSLRPDAPVIPPVLPISPGNTSLGTCPAIFLPRVAIPAPYVQQQRAQTPRAAAAEYLSHLQAAGHASAGAGAGAGASASPSQQQRGLTHTPNILEALSSQHAPPPSCSLLDEVRPRPARAA